MFDAVEKLVRRSGCPRRELYAEAPREYVAGHSPDEVTEALKAVLERAGASPHEDRFVSEAARRVLADNEW